MKNTFWSKAIILILFFATLSGCASKGQERFFWPPPPNEPRLEWLRAIRSEGDLPKGSLGSLMSQAAGTSSLGAFERPIDVASDGGGRVYVSDNVSHDVFLLDMNRGEMHPVGTAGTFKSPLGLDVDDGGNLYVVDGGRNVVLVFSPEQKPLTSIGNAELFNKPAFIAVSDELQRVYVTDVKENRVVVFSKRGEYLFSFGESGKDDGQFHAPQGIAVTGEGKVFVVDMFNFRVQVFDAEGKYLGQFGQQGTQPWQFELPKDIAVDSDGNLHVTDARKPALLTFRQDGQFLLLTGMGRSTHAMSFTVPAGLGIDANDRMFIADTMLRRVTEWQYLSEKFREANPIDPDLLEEQKQRMEKILEEPAKQ